MALVVLSAGFQTTVQDCGRIGFRKFGVATAGALDFAALRILNLLVGNDECAAGFEVVHGRVRLKFADSRLVAWSGGDLDARVDESPIPSLHCARISPETICEISAKRGPAWLAISGGIDVPRVLESRSTDLRAGFGGWQGRALRDGDEIPLGLPNALSARIMKDMKSAIADWSGPSLSSSRAQSRNPEEVISKKTQLDPSTSLGMTGVLRVIPGKNWTDEAGASFLAATFRVAMNSDRMGLRLEGPGIKSDVGELVSAAVTTGTIQLPPAGTPILLLADCQTIGGYPKIAHVITVDFARAAQLQPMDKVRFELTSLEYARELLQERERDIALFRAGLEARFG